MPVIDFLVRAPRAYSTVVVTTGGNVDTRIELDREEMAKQANQLKVGMERFNLNGTIVNDISSDNRNSQVTFSNVTIQQFLSFRIWNDTMLVGLFSPDFDITKTDRIITVTVQGNR